MAVKDDIYYPTEDLILSNPRRHFRTTVNAVHWQLRSLIGVEKENLVYFASGKLSLNIQRLNTTTHETETIKRLPFQPRCLVARNGWVCCGGETGEFAAIYVGEDAGDNEPEPETNANSDSDDRIPLDLDPSRPEDSIFASLTRLRPEKTLLARSKKFGKERVNCITLWFAPTLVELSEGAYNQPVAVLSNNDKTVSVVSLWGDQEAIDELSYPDCVNRALLSPDGRLLVAVSDDPYLYVHERVEMSSGSSSVFRTSDRPIYTWKPCQKIHLKSQRKEDRTDSRGSFAACFSSTGRFLAVGTQYGTISIFNVAAFFSTADVDPLITSFNSSRTYAELGAVRDMAFAPGPIDLLAWTEDRGRVGVADLRSGFVSRQILKLDMQDDYEHVNVVETPLERGFIDPRLLETRSERNEPLSSSFADTLDLTLEGRTLGGRPRRPEAREIARELERFHGPPTPDETLVLEALQEHRRRREQRAAGPDRQAAGTPGPRLAWPERSMRPHDNSRPRERSASVTRAVNDILGNIRDRQERLRDYQERLRTLNQNDPDRGGRRGALASAASATATAPPTTSTTTTTTGGAFGTARTTPSTSASTDGERRALISRLITAHSPPPVASGLENLEALAAYLMRDWDNDTPTRRTNSYGWRSIAADPHDTSGLSWSEDGQVLYVGAENGIYEFRVNICGRRLFPSIGLR